ncbi:uncharacterized protein LOC5516219 isoform X2 [Nematostella vectensis]|nr:uncharacterized protein LOC5516219 isoform X2 [Nematostella vectensis]
MVRITQLLMSFLAMILVAKGNCLSSVPPGSSMDPQIKAVMDWCGNFTGHVNTVMGKLHQISFNKSNALMSSGLKESARLEFDRRDLSIYALLFDELTPGATHPQGKLLEKCIKTNRAMLESIIVNIRLAELYLDGSILLPPFTTTSTQLRYEDLAGDMGSLKAQFRGLAILIGNLYVTQIISPVIKVK